MAPYRLSGVVRRVEAGIPADYTPWRQPIFRATAALAIITGLLTFGLVGRHLWIERQTLQQARIGARKSAHDQAKTIDDRLRAIEPVATGIARDLSAGTLKPADLEARLRQELAAKSNLFEIGVVYAPFAKDPATKLFGPHVSRSATGVDFFPLESRYDYTTYDWYKDGIAANAPHWGEPYFGGATQTLVVGYSVPFYKPGDATHPSGLVRTNLSMDAIRHIVSGLNLGQTGYGFLLSRKGVYLSDPVEDYVKQQRTIFEIAKQKNDDARKQIGDRALAGTAGEANSVSGVTGQATWIMAEPVPSAHWTLGAVFIQEEFLPEPREIRRSLARIEMCALVCLFFCGVLWFRAYEGGPRVLWNIAITQTILFVGGIGFMWWLTLHYPDRNGEVAVHIVDQSELQKFIETRSTAQNGRPPATQVPTGLYIRTLRFGSGNDVLVTGYLWQRYPRDSADSTSKITQGFKLIDAESMDATETYRHRQVDGEVVGWDFKATVRERFEGAIKYPFDHALVRMRIAPKDLDRNVVLVPDLYAYQLLTPTALPGVEKNLVLPGWDLDRAYFNYSPTTYNTSLGVSELASRDRSYELGYTLVAQRRFLDPFISSVLPMIVIACLLFGLLVIGSRESSKVAATGFKATDVLRASITLLFPVLIAEVNLRTKIGSNTIIYIEYFYFVLYAAILGVAANALMFTLRNSGFAHLRDNLLPKVVFWPALAGACFAVTLVFLY